MEHLFKKFLATLVTLAMVLSVITMSGFNTVSAKTKKKVNSVTVTNVENEELTLEVKETFTLKTEVSVTGKASKKVTYKSSNKKVAKVSSKGKITAKKAGTAKITVASKANKKKKVVIIVTVVEAAEQTSTTEQESGAEEEATDDDSETQQQSEQTPAEETTTSMPKASFDGKAKNVDVVVNAGEGAFPEGTTMEVTDVKADDVKDVVSETLGEEVEKLEAFDISFKNADGKEIEPNISVSVKLTSEVSVDDNISVVHIADDGTAEVIKNVTVDAENNVVTFKANEFSTYTISWGTRRYNIHYVDTNGNSLTPTRTPEFSNDYKYLIYDVEGYEYDSTHYGSRTGTAIKPLLANYGNDRIYLDNNNDWQYLRNDIYVVYKKKTEPTTGGTPEVKDETWPEGNDAPQFSKSSTNNNNGTNTISLSIKAGEKPVEKSTPADVIVVFDVSGSMGDNMDGQTRLARAKDAVKTMADTLLNGSNSDVRMALVSFSTSASTVQDFTNNYTTFSNKVDGLSANGGTNWELALNVANHLNVRSNAATFVVFVTDGDPTFRMSRGDVSDSSLDVQTSYYYNNLVFGTGNSDNSGRNFNFAVDQVKEIKRKDKQFYAVGISNDVTKVQNLTTQGGVDASHAFIASDSTAMENAFKSITESIKSILGFGDVEITDGITSLSNTEMEVLEEVDPNSFQYYRYGGEGNKYGEDEAHKTEWTSREADGCAEASYNEAKGAVEWNMGESFQLESGVTYVVTFRVWPSQEAYDLVADLNNGIKSYDNLTDEEKSQVVELNTNPVTYALKTNTDEVNATYNKTTKTGEVVTISDTKDIEATYHEGDIENMNLTSMKLTIKKEFEDDLTSGEDRQTEVTLVLKRRNSHQTPEAEFKDYAVPQGGTTSANIVLNKDNNWQYELYVAPGLEVDGEVLEHGYDFTITEPDIDYHYGLIEEIINPMVVDGEEKYYGDGYLIDDDDTISKYTDQSLTAVNRVKSGIDIMKVVIDPDGNEILPEDEFIIKGKLLDKDGNPFTWKDGDSVDASGAYHKYDKDGNRIVYKGHFADTSNIEFTLKAGERVRFINVPDGCTFEFDEDTIPDGYEWNKTEAATQHRTAPGGSYTQDGDVQPVVDGSKVKLDSGVVGNKQYSVTFTNKSVHGEAFYVYHSSDNTIEKIFAEDSRVTKGAYNAETKTYEYTFNIVNETKDKHLYGGYYKAYGQTTATDDEIKALTYNKSDSAKYEYTTKTESLENWAKDDKGTPYTGSKATTWKKANAYTADKGTEMHPVANTVYYLKEVPNCYLRPYIQVVYDINNGNKIDTLYMITAVDDGNYTQVGFYDGSSDKSSTQLSSTVKITQKNSDKPITLTAKGVFNGKSYADGSITMPRGYLTSIESSPVSQFAMQPYFKTLDGVKVYGVTNRTVKPGNGTFVDDGAGAGKLPGMTAEDVTNKKAAE